MATPVFDGPLPVAEPVIFSSGSPVQPHEPIPGDSNDEEPTQARLQGCPLSWDPWALEGSNMQVFGEGR